MPTLSDASNEAIHTSGVWLQADERKGNLGDLTLQFRVEHCLCSRKRKRKRLPVPRLCPSRPLPSLMPFSAATLRLCSSSMFSWDTVRLGCLRMHCMIQCGARGQAAAVGRAGGPCHPCRDPCSSSSSGGSLSHGAPRSERRQRDSGSTARRGRAESSRGWDSGKSLPPLRTLDAELSRGACRQLPR